MGNDDDDDDDVAFELVVFEFDDIEDSCCPA
jgi:hypothetical protein